MALTSLRVRHCIASRETTVITKTKKETKKETKRRCAFSIVERIKIKIKPSDISGVDVCRWMQL